MVIAISILYGLALIMLLIVMGARPARSTLSRFELERRSRAGNPEARLALRREELLHDIYSVQHVLTALLLVLISALSVLVFHWTLGFILSLLIALEAGAVARLKPIRLLSAHLYNKLESRFLNIIETRPKLFRLLRTVAPLSNEPYIVQSRDELLELVNQSMPAALNDQEKQLIKNSLQFKTRKVSEIMTPRQSVDSVKKSEMLGPLVLDELHKTGHSRFPVIDKDLDHIIGVLHIQSMLNLGVKRSVTAEKAMEPVVNFIRADQTIAHALAAYLRTRHQLFIVIDEHQKTVGVLSFKDVIEALLGHELRDEFEQDNSPYAVAGRQV